MSPMAGQFAGDIIGQTEIRQLRIKAASDEAPIYSEDPRLGGVWGDPLARPEIVLQPVEVVPPTQITIDDIFPTTIVPPGPIYDPTVALVGSENGGGLGQSWTYTPPALVALPPVVGTMLIMAGQRVLVSIAVRGANDLYAGLKKKYHSPGIIVRFFTGLGRALNNAPYRESETRHDRDDGRREIVPPGGYQGEYDPSTGAPIQNPPRDPNWLKDWIMNQYLGGLEDIMPYESMNRHGSDFGSWTV